MSCQQGKMVLKLCFIKLNVLMLLGYWDSGENVHRWLIILNITGNSMTSAKTT